MGGFVVAAGTGVDPQDVVVPLLGDGGEGDFVVEKRFVDEVPRRGAGVEVVGGGGGDQGEKDDECGFSNGAHGGGIYD